MGNLVDREVLKEELSRALLCEEPDKRYRQIIDIIDNAPEVKTFIDKIERVTTSDGRTSIVGRNLTKEEEALFYMLTNHDILTYSKLGGQVVPDMLQGWRYREGDDSNEIN